VPTRAPTTRRDGVEHGIVGARDRLQQHRKIVYMTGPPLSAIAT
jgi:hypothetical protein